MVQKTKLFALPKFWSLQGSTLASLNIGEILAIRENCKFLKLGVALILRCLFTHLLFFKQALVRPAPEMAEE